MRLYWEGDYHGTIQLINSLSFYKNESHSNASMIFESSDNLIARKMAAEFIMGMVQNDLTDIKGN